MSKKRNKAKKDAKVTKPVEGVDPETCEHIDDNADGHCDLCGIEVEAVEDDPEDEINTIKKDPPADEKKSKKEESKEKQRSKDPRMQTTETPPIIAPSMPATKTVFRVRPGKFFDPDTNTWYKKGDPIEVSPENYDRLKNFIQ